MGKDLGADFASDNDPHSKREGDRAPSPRVRHPGRDPRPGKTPTGSDETTTDAPRHPVSPWSRPHWVPRGRWKVARVDTEPMTTEHYDQAVTALAALIAQWKHHQERTTEDGEGPE
jgi:hypothetical protein